ncbi:paraquat-inducible protein A [Pokkaliibacter sp. CJK22405]|uniref:paraquat-inducible protein A n=1 Tax=Pokkaliibacter sp. CJK22405 TaxID=3384615 RepID=UPI003984DD57
MSSPAPESLNSESEGAQPAERWIACHECDAVFPMIAMKHRQDAYCPRCGGHLFAHREGTIQRSLALAIAAFCFFIPTVSLPLIQLDVLGLNSSVTLIEAVIELVQEQYWWTAFLVAACSIVVPFLEISLLIFVLGIALLERAGTLTIMLFRWWHVLRGWGMLEVYLIGILVAMVKLLDMASVTLGFGLYAFVGMLLMLLTMMLSLDPHEVWEQLDTQKTRRRSSNEDVAFVKEAGE